MIVEFVMLVEVGQVINMVNMTKIISVKRCEIDINRDQESCA